MLAHGIVLGLLIYTYQQPDLEVAGTIETTMVSPGELAEMQGQILANRAAAEAQAANSSSSALATEQINAADSNNANQNSTQPSSQRVPVFINSDDLATRPILMSEEQHQRQLEQIEEYNRNMAEWAAELDDTTNEKLDEVQQQKKSERDEQREQLQGFRSTEKNPVKIVKPNSTQRNINIESESAGSDSTGESQSLADGKLKPSGGGAKNSSNSPSRSTGDFKRGIADKIQRNLKAPIETQGTSARVTLKLDARGNVISATASGSNATVNEAAEKAAYASSPLTIDLDNPSSLENIVINVKVQ